MLDNGRHGERQKLEEIRNDAKTFEKLPVMRTQGQGLRQLTARCGRLIARVTILRTWVLHTLPTDYIQYIVSRLDDPSPDPTKPDVSDPNGTKS